jgi:hypothetical protein
MNKNKILIDLSESTRTDFGKVDFSEQSEPQKVFSAIWELESQVNNGGFLQFFEYADADSAEYAPTALRAIGAQTCAEIVHRALRAVSPSPLPASQPDREKLIGAVSESARDQLVELDEQFLAYPDNLTDLLFSHVAAHPESFGPVESE